MGVTDTEPASGRKRNPVVITSLASSRTAEIRERERRYVYLMLPWLAVVLANQPKVQAVKHAVYQPRTPRVTPTLEPGREHRVIDPDL